MLKQLSPVTSQQAHCGMIPEQWTWLLCSASAIPKNTLWLQYLNQLIGILLLTSGFLEILVRISISRGKMPPMPPTADEQSSLTEFTLLLLGCTTITWGWEDYDNPLVVTVTVTCYSWSPSSGDHLFAYGPIFWPPQTWDIRDRDLKKRVSRPSLETPSLLLIAQI